MLRRGVRNTLQTEPDLEICGEAVDGQEPVDKARELQPDLVILDINMPVLNGLVAVRQILRYCPSAKIVIFSVLDSEQIRQEMRAAGAQALSLKAETATIACAWCATSSRETLWPLRRLRPNRPRHLRANRRNPPAKVTIIFSLI